MCLDDLAKFIGMGKDLAIAAAAVVTATVAVRGLRSWQHEMRGKADFSTAQEMIKATYKLRSAIELCRAAWFDVSEFPNNYNERQGGAREEGSAYGHIFKARWAPVYEAYQNFLAASFDAEVLWGDAVREKVDDLRRCVVSLRSSIDAYVANKFEGGATFAADDRYAKLIQSEVTVAQGDTGNQLTDRINKAIGSIEDLVRPYLKRN